MKINDRIKKHNAKITAAAAETPPAPTHEYKTVRGYINKGKVARMLAEGWR